MKRFIKLILVIFSILTLLAIVENFNNHSIKRALILSLINLLFNTLFALFFVYLGDLLYSKLGKKALFGVLFVLFFFFYWYILGEINKFIINKFLYIQTIFFYYGAQADFYQLLIFWGIVFGILASVIFIYKFHLKGNLVKLKTEFFKLIFIVILTIVLFFALPQNYVSEASQSTNFFFHVLTFLPVYSDSINIQEGDKIFNGSFNLNRPNIIVIIMESVSFNRLHYAGYNKKVTPNIDFLAKNGIVFENAYSSATHTEYSQTAFLSSRYPLKDTIRDNFKVNYPKCLICDILKSENYITGYFSSQNDNWLGIGNYYNLSSLNVYSDSLSDGKYDYGSGKARKDRDNETLYKVLKFIDNSSSPFFVYINFDSTHYPYVYPQDEAVYLPDLYESAFSPVPSQTIKKEDLIPINNRYNNAIIYVDNQIGKLTEYLIKNNLFNKTIIIITADHGENLDNAHEASGHGQSVYEEVVHVPLIFYIPDFAPKVVKERVKHIDVVPTLLVGLNFPVSPLFQGKEMRKNSKIFFIAQTTGFFVGEIIGDLKYIYNIKELKGEAYNLTSDPHELNNLVLNSSFNFKAYRSDLLKWYHCQIDYYAGEYLINNKIKC